VQISLLILVISWAENLTNNPLQSAFAPYTLLLGPGIFFSMFFGTILVGAYLGSKNFPIVIGVSILITIVFAVLLPFIFLFMIALLATLMTTSLLYYALVVKQTQ